MNHQIQIPQAVLLPAHTMFHTQDGNIKQLVYFDRSQSTNLPLDLPLGKSLRGSVFYSLDPSDPTGNTIAQQVSISRSVGKKYSTSIHDTRYSHVKVSQSRITVSMSFPLGDDPTRLKARMQNFANILIDESDEIAAMLNQEGDELVLGAWETLAETSLEEKD